MTTSQNEIIDIRFSSKTPAKVIARTIENEIAFGMCFHDAFEEAARFFGKQNTKLWAAWHYSDFREFIPCAYIPEFADWINSLASTPEDLVYEIQEFANMKI